MLGIRRTMAIAAITSVMLAAVVPVGAAGASSAASADESNAAGKLQLVLDSSGSMKEPDASGTTKIKAARQALRQVVDGLDEEAQVGMRVFGATVFSRDDEGACEDSQQVVPIDSGNAAELKAAIGEYKPYGETPIGYALQEAAKDLGSEGQRTIMLVSDGEATCAPDPCQVAQDLAKDGIDLKIDVVGFDVSGKARNQLACVAEKGNGTYYDVDDADELSSTMQSVSTRAMEPFEVTGTPVEDTPATADAPVLETGGQYTDTAPAEGDELHYTIERTMSSSNVVIGAIGAPRGAFGGGNLTGIDMTVLTPDGEECGSSFASAVNFQKLMSGSVSTLNDYTTQDDPCNTAEELELVITQADIGNYDVMGTPFQLKLWEFGETAGYNRLPQPLDYDDITWQKMTTDAQGATSLAGGTSLSAATEIEAGESYSDTVVPGETRVFRLPVGWGQRLQAQATFPEANDKLSDALGAAPSVALDLFGPLGTAVSNSEANDGTSTNISLMWEAEGDTLQDGTSEVRYRNLESGHDFMTGAAYAGDYYVSVTADTSKDAAGVEIPFTVSAEVVGEEGAAPEFSDVRAPGDVPVMDAAGDPVESDAEPAADGTDEGDDQAITPMTAAIGIGGLLLLLAGGYGALRVVRRRAS